MKKYIATITALLATLCILSAPAAARNGTITELTPLMYSTGMALLPVTTVSAATYTLQDGDLVIDVTRTSTGICTLTIPTSSVKAGKFFIVKDTGRGAGTYNITIATAGADTIDGANTYVISSDGAALLVYSDGTNWSIALGYLSPQTTASGGSIAFGSRTVLTSPADDKIKFCNAASSTCWIADLTGDGLVSLFAANGLTAAGLTIGALTTSGAWTLSADTAVTLSGGVDGINFDSNTLSIDATANRVGIGTAAPAVPLDVVGAIATTTSVSAATLSLTTPTTVEYRLSSTASVNVGSIAEYQLYTVPGGKTAIVTKIVIRSCSGTLDQVTDAVAKVGFNAGTHDDVIGAKTLAAPTAATGYQILLPTASNATGNVQSTHGAAADELAINVTTAATASTTCTVDVFGYLF